MTSRSAEASWRRSRPTTPASAATTTSESSRPLATSTSRVSEDRCRCLSNWMVALVDGVDDHHGHHRVVGLVVGEQPDLGAVAAGG